MINNNTDNNKINNNNNNHRDTINEKYNKDENIKINFIFKIIIIISIIKLIINCIKCIFRGIGEIFLADNGYTGLFFLVGLYYENPVMATVALSCTIISTLTAVLLRLDKSNIMKGLYGFNSALIGCALVFYFQLNGYVIVGFIIGSVVSTLIMEFFLRNNLPAYTFPFIFTTWVLLWIMRSPGANGYIEAKIPSDTIDYKVLMDYSMPAHSFGQVIFLGDAISGLLVLLGVYIWSPIACLYGIISTIITAGISNYFIDVAGSAVSEFRIHSGLYGFNAVLCGIAQSGTKTIDGCFVLVSLVISTTFYIMLIQNNFTSLTFPFVLSMWFCCVVKFIQKDDFSNLEKNLNNTVLVLNFKLFVNNLIGLKYFKKFKKFKDGGDENNSSVNNMDGAGASTDGDDNSGNNNITDYDIIDINDNFSGSNGGSDIELDLK